ncbi:MAG: hypothetical protein M3300_12555 [Actinomycetota bacterium]|jgi:hypothetical protein|nr:hypothetical protein [Actinomycetota bacterium]
MAIELIPLGAADIRLAHIFIKLGIPSRAHLVAGATRRGLDHDVRRDPHSAGAKQGKDGQ